VATLERGGHGLVNGESSALTIGGALILRERSTESGDHPRLDTVTMLTSYLIEPNTPDLDGLNLLYLINYVAPIEDEIPPSPFLRASGFEKEKTTFLFVIRCFRGVFCAETS